MTNAEHLAILAWGVETDETARQDLIVGMRGDVQESPLRAQDLRTAPPLALMLMRPRPHVAQLRHSKLVLILGSFSLIPARRTID